MLPELQAICSRQKKSENIIYRPSRFCVEVDCDEGKLLYNTFTGMLVLLENGQIPDGDRDELIKTRFFVPEGFDEDDYSDKVMSVLKTLKAGNGSNTGKNSFTVLTTTDCNARCRYCYEAGIDHCYMSADTAKDVSDYIIRSSGGSGVKLRWFGGEPMMNTRAIDVICERLREAGITYASKMVSNGYCFDKAAADKAVSLWNLKSIQITLDGTAEVYNRVKAYKNGDKDAYSRVIKNIDDALDAGVSVQIRMNVSSKNAPELMCLADDLAARFPDRKGLSAYPSLLGEFDGFARRFSGDDHDVDSFSALTEKLKNTGLYRKRSPLKREIRINGCMADNDACDVILPDGRLCRCDVLLDKDCCGSVYSEEKDHDNIKSWKERVKLPECFDCPLYPKCINLKKCVWVGENCSKTNRKIRINTLESQIIDTYNEWKERSE